MLTKFDVLTTTHFTYMVTNCLLVKIFLSVHCIYYKLMKLNLAMFLVLLLSSWWWQILEKPTVFSAKTEYWSVTLLLLRKLRAVSNMLS